jgi:excisionase family DNA binding protein
MKATNNAKDFGRLLGLPEVAERLSISLATARKWAALRRLPIVKLGGRVLVSERDLERLVESRRVAPRGEVAV